MLDTIKAAESLCGSCPLFTWPMEAEGIGTLAAIRSHADSFTTYL